MRDCSSLDPVLGVEPARVLRNSMLRLSAAHAQLLVLVSDVGGSVDPWASSRPTGRRATRVLIISPSLAIARYVTGFQRDWLRNVSTGGI